jgi:ABC-type uncharacterized transport system permease subunit
MIYIQTVYIAHIIKLIYFSTMAVVYWFVQVLVHFVVSNDSSIAFSKPMSPQSAILWFLFQFPLPFNFFKVTLYLLTSSSSSSRHFYHSSVFSLIICFKRLFLR